MYRLVLVILFCISQTAFGQEIFTNHQKFDFGIITAPSASPETNWDKAKIRFGIHIGYTYYKFYQNISLKERVTSYQPPNTRFITIGLGLIQTSPVITILPIGFEVYKKVFVSPGLAIGKNPYANITISVELE